MLMGGVITVESEPGKGSTFAIALTLPLAGMVPPQPAAPAAGPCLTGKVLVVDDLGMAEIKTKTFAGFLGAVGSKKALVVTGCPNVVKSARNIPGVVTTTARMLSVYDLVNAKYLVIDKSALDTIEEVYA